MDRLNTFLLHTYRAAQRRHPDILYLGQGAGQRIALTFDDGPHPRDTPRLLEVLEKHRVRATFHLVGKSAERQPDLVRHIYQCRHQLALHSYRHTPLPLEDPKKLRAALVHSQNVIAGTAGLPPSSIRDLRPPYGLFNMRTLSRLQEWGFRLVMWSCIPPHWMQPVGWSIHQVVDSAVPGAVIVLHDGHGHGRRVAEIVEAVVPRIHALGYEFVTVEEMQALKEQVAHPATVKE